MSHALTVPDDIYTRVEAIAQATDQSVEQVMLDHLRVLAWLPADEQAELKALRHLSDDALWTIAAEQMSDTTKARLQTLMQRNTSGTLTPDEHTELSALVERGDRLMVRKAEAAGILMERGHKVAQQDLSRTDH